MNLKEIIKMNKTELVREIANRIEGATQRDIACVIDTFAEVVKETVVAGDKVALTGFLTFDKKHVPAKSGIVQLGDKKGQTWETPEKDEVKVSLSKTYKAI